MKNYMNGVTEAFHEKSWWQTLLFIWLLSIKFFASRNSRFTAVNNGLLLANLLYQINPAQSQIITTPFPDKFSLADLDGQNGFKIKGRNAYDISGYSVNFLKDIDGDAINELIVTAPTEGAVYIIYGRATMVNESILLKDIQRKNYGFKIEVHGSGSAADAGDVNADGINDIVISNQGIFDVDSRYNAAYIIFGNKARSNATFILGNLNGRNGLTFLRSTGGGRCCKPAANAGDFNGDGVDDVIMGDSTAGENGKESRGESYIIFGRRGEFNATFLLADLDGNNGFRLIGTNRGDYTGASVARAGDINSDGIDDVLIGANGASPNGRLKAGISYVVFGSRTPFPGNFSLDTLNGSNGFSIEGINPNDWSGISVAGARDVNDDGIDDIAIGACQASLDGKEFTGQSYVVFGNKIGFGARFSLAELDGMNGFIIDGVDKNDESGAAVAGLGDLNGDGIDDFAIGAPSHSCASYQAGLVPIARPGKTFVIFGSKKFYSRIPVSELNLNNGFTLQGIGEKDQSGFSVAGAGDVNGDGVKDMIIGAFGANNASGESYVVFGRRVLRKLRLENNQINLYKPGSSFTLTELDLALFYELASKRLMGLLNITFSAVMHGEFKLNGISQNSPFSIEQVSIANQSLSFTHDGSDELPDYQVTVTDGRSQIGPFRVKALLQLHNLIKLTQNEALILNTTHLLTKLTNRTATEVRYDTTQAIALQVYSANDNRMLTSFTQAQLDAFSIVIKSNSSSLTIPNQIPKLSFNITDSRLQTFIARVDANLHYFLIPSIVTNRITIRNPGDTVTFSLQQLSVKYGEDSGDDLSITFDNVIGGVFKLNGMQRQAPFTIKGRLIRQGFLSFSHDGSDTLPSYLVSVSDGRKIVGPERVSVGAPFAKQQPPQIITNQLSLNESEHKVLTRNNLYSEDDAVADTALIRYFLIRESLTHIFFNQLVLNRTNIEEFSQKDVDDEVIEVVHDGEDAMPSVSFQVSDGELTGMTTQLNITFNANQEDAPVLKVNEVLITQGEVIPVTTSWIMVTDSDAGDQGNLIIKIISSTHGYFRKVGVDNVLDEFHFADVVANQIEFVHDASTEAPQISLQASDGKLSSDSQMVAVRFAQVGGNGNTIPVAVGSVGGVLCFAGLFAVGFAVFRKRQANASRKGNDIDTTVSRIVYERLNIKGVSNFKSGPGLKYVSQIVELNQAYQRVNGEIADVDSYSEALARAIKSVLSADGDVDIRGNALSFNIADDNKPQPLRRHREIIVERYQEIQRYNSTRSIESEASSRNEVPMQVFD